MSEEKTEPTEEDGVQPNEGVQNAEPPEPSLGPACLVIGILSMALMVIVCAFGSFFAFSDQHSLAIKGINMQLIPWIETSQLSKQDQDQIVTKLRDLIAPLEAKTYDKRQMTRLRNCLQDNPVLLWGGIEKVQQQAASSGLTELEQETLDRVCQRLLRGAAERKFGRNDIEFTIQNCSKVREGGQSLIVLDNLTAEQIREFMTRAEQLVVQNDIPNEPFDKTAGQAFAILVDTALTVE